MSPRWTFLILATVLALGSVAHATETSQLPTSAEAHFNGEFSLAVVPEPSYSLGAGDRVNIVVFQAPQYSGETSVLVDGTVNLPVIGNVNVQGLTLEQASEAISARFARILRRPIVTVRLLAPRPAQIGVAGEVERPGAYTVNRDQTQPPTVTQIIETAGGIRQSADLRRVQIRRQSRGEQEQIINVDLWQFLQTGDLSHNPTLRDGDAVFVPTATEIDLVESPQLATASFSPTQNAPISIAVVGEVYRPGSYVVTGSARTAQAGVPGGADGMGLTPSVTRAIQVAGGITPTADIRRIQIRRVTRTGTEQTFEVNLWDLLQRGQLEQDAILQDRDTVFIPMATNVDSSEANQIAAASFSPNTIRVNVVGEVPRPGVVEVPPNTSLNQTVLAAGGFNNRAYRSSVELLRLNLDGSVVRRTVEIDFSQGINDETNPPLRNNDVVVVRRSGVASFSDTLGTLTDPIARFFTLFSLPLNFLRLF